MVRSPWYPASISAFQFFRPAIDSGEEKVASHLPSEPCLATWPPAS
jgi:hypothetical protein